MSITTTIAGIPTSFIGTASGARDTTPEELMELANQTHFLSLKSTTLLHREGNPRPRYARTPLGAIQAMGLPNHGLANTLEYVENIARPGLVIKASVAGGTLEENVALVKAFQESKVDLIELNPSCPNLATRPIVRDFRTLEAWLEVLTALGPKPLGVKVPYFEDAEELRALAEILIRWVAFVTGINSILGLEIDPRTGTTRIHANGGMGGICGAALKPFGLRQVWLLHQFLKGTGVSIIGVGGIHSGSDAYEYLLAGADAVEVGATLENNGPLCLPRITLELEKILRQEGKTLADTRGSLQVCAPE